MSGSTVIGTRLPAAIAGTRAIGAVRPTLVLAGLLPAMKAAATLAVTGTVRADISITTIIGTAIRRCATTLASKNMKITVAVTPTAAIKIRTTTATTAKAWIVL